VTLPNERTRAVLGMEQAVKALAPYATGRTWCARVPRDLIRELQHWLKHYPTCYDISITAERAPDLWAQADERPR